MKLFNESRFKGYIKCDEIRSNNLIVFIYINTLDLFEIFCLNLLKFELLTRVFLLM